MCDYHYVKWQWTVSKVLFHCLRWPKPLTVHQPLTVDDFWGGDIFWFGWLLLLLLMSLALRWPSFRISRFRVCIVRSSPEAVLTSPTTCCIAGCGVLTEQAGKHVTKYLMCDEIMRVQYFRHTHRNADLIHYFAHLLKDKGKECYILLLAHRWINY